MLQGIFGRAEKTSDLSSSLKYIVSTKNTETWKNISDTYMNNIHKTLVKHASVSDTNINQSQIVSIGDIFAIDNFTLNISQKTDTLDMSRCTSEIFQSAINKELTNLVSEVDAAFKREDVSTLKSAISKEEQNSMVSSLLKSIGAGPDETVKIANILESKNEIEKAYEQELTKIRTEINEKIKQIDFSEMFTKKVDQLNKTSIGNISNSTNVRLTFSQDARAISQFYSDFKILDIFERALNNSDIFKMHRSDVISTTTTAETTTTTVEKNETFGDILKGLFSGLMMPLIVVGLALVVFLVIYLGL